MENQVRTGGRFRREPGASLVEFAFVLPVLVVLLFGLITGGIALSQQNSVKNAVRESSRFGAVLPTFPGDGDPVPADLSALYAQVVAAATGDLDPEVDGRIICVAMIDGKSPNEWWWQVYTNTSVATASGDEDQIGSVDPRCTEGFDASVAATNRRIWIRAERKTAIDAILFEVPITLETESLSRYER